VQEGITISSHGNVLATSKERSRKMPRILVVDDEEHIRQFLELELTEAGYDVVTVARCMGVLNKIETTLPDVVILDMMLADTEGVELLQRIRKVYHELAIILLCSPYDSYKAAAADYCVMKSHDLTELETKVRQAVEANAAKILSTLHAHAIQNRLPCHSYFSIKD
jgi:DNA-binding response OmpR family regulator